MCWSLRPVMNPDFLRLAPGHLLLHRLIDDLSDHGFVGLDLGRTVEAAGQIGYKAQYQPQWSAMLGFKSRLLSDDGNVFGRRAADAVDRPAGRLQRLRTAAGAAAGGPR